jgi:hypothetical protein
VGPRPATSIPPSGKLSWLPRLNPKALPATAIAPRLPVVTFELRGPSTGAKHGVRRLAGHLHGGSHSDCSERGVASDPVECRATAVHYARAHPMLRSRPGLESAARGNAASCVSTTPLTWRRGSMTGIASLPFPCIAAACATATLRRRGLSSQDSRHRCRYPAPALGRLRPELLPDVPPAFDSPIAGRSDRGGSRYLSLPLVPSCGLRRRMCGCGSGPSRPVTSSQIIFAPTHLHARHSRWL